jgi:hypothetical protein
MHIQKVKFYDSRIYLKLDRVFLFIFDDEYCSFIFRGKFRCDRIPKETFITHDIINIQNSNEEDSKIETHSKAYKIQIISIDEDLYEFPEQKLDIPKVKVPTRFSIVSPITASSKIRNIKLKNFKRKNFHIKFKVSKTFQNPIEFGNEVSRYNFSELLYG